MTTNDAELQARFAGCPAVGSVWRHYKGMLYIVLGHALLEEDLDPLVWYCRQDGTGVLWARRLSVWNTPEIVDDIAIPRYVRVQQMEDK